MSYDSQRRGISACYSPLKEIKSTAVGMHGNISENSAFGEKKQEVDTKRNSRLVSVTW